MRHYLKLYRIIGGTFGFRVRPIGTFLLFQIRHIVATATLGLDDIFFPEYRTLVLDRPIFIIGNPRSGTTFLHRLLLGAGDLAALELWEMLLPSITARRLFGAIMPRIDKLNPAQYHPSDAHDTSLRGIETDDLLEFFHTLDGPFAWAYFLAWQGDWGSEQADRSFGIGAVPPEDEDRLFGYNDACWRRNLAYKNAGRILVKSSMLTFRLKSLLRRYPDARLLYVVRDPAETIPSGISLLSGALENGFDVWNRTGAADQARWRENMYQVSAAMFRSFHDQYLHGSIPERNLLVVRYTDLIDNLEPTITAVLDFIEVDAPDAFLTEVREQDAKQRAYTSKHSYSAQGLGLDAERIRADLGFVYETFKLETTGGTAVPGTERGTDR